MASVSAMGLSPRSRMRSWELAASSSGSRSMALWFRRSSFSAVQCDSASPMLLSRLCAIDSFCRAPHLCKQVPSYVLDNKRMAQRSKQTKAAVQTVTAAGTATVKAAGQLPTQHVAEVPQRMDKTMSASTVAATVGKTRTELHSRDEEMHVSEAGPRSAVRVANPALDLLAGGCKAGVLDGILA